MTSKTKKTEAKKTAKKPRLLLEERNKTWDVYDGRRLVAIIEYDGFVYAYGLSFIDVESSPYFDTLKAVRRAVRKEYLQYLAEKRGSS